MSSDNKDDEKDAAVAGAADDVVEEEEDEEDLEKLQAEIARMEAGELLVSVATTVVRDDGSRTIGFFPFFPGAPLSLVCVLSFFSFLRLFHMTPVRCLLRLTMMFAWN